MHFERNGSMQEEGLNKALSPLTVVAGFVQGWAHDTLRDTLTVDLYLDNTLVVTGRTGYVVANAYFFHFTMTPVPHLAGLRRSPM